MSTTEAIALGSVLFSAVSAGGAIFSLVLATRAIRQAGQASRASEDMFRRQGVIDLHMAWQGVNEIKATELIGPDVVRAANALTLTAALWNHDVIDKRILYQTYWDPFRELYETLSTSSEVVPGFTKRCRDLISREVTKAYEGMKATELDAVIQTSIGEEHD